MAARNNSCSSHFVSLISQVSLFMPLRLSITRQNKNKNKTKNVNSKLKRSEQVITYVLAITSSRALVLVRVLNVITKGTANHITISHRHYPHTYPVENSLYLHNHIFHLVWKVALEWVTQFSTSLGEASKVITNTLFPREKHIVVLWRIHPDLWDLSRVKT